MVMMFVPAPSTSAPMAFRQLARSMTSGSAAALISWVSGSYTNVVGLPLERLKAELDLWRRDAELPNPAIAMLAEQSIWATMSRSSQPAQFLP